MSFWKFEELMDDVIQFILNRYPNEEWDPAWAMPDLDAYERHLRSISASELSFVPSSMYVELKKIKKKRGLDQ